MKVLQKKDMNKVIKILDEAYPDAESALDFGSLFELIIAVVLSAQTTDVSVNKVTPELFSRYPNAESLAAANNEDVEKIINKIGMYRQKSKNIIALSQMIMDEYDGEVPSDYDKLIRLAGVGRKTANVVLSVGFGEQRIAVDTHVYRVSNRIGLCNEKDVLSTELALMKNIPKSEWSKAHHSLIWHGRKVCNARKPNCNQCVVNKYCLYNKSS